MIVCSCNVFSDRDVRRTLESAHPPRRTRDVYTALGCAPQCGCCADTIAAILAAERRKDEAKGAKAMKLEVAA